MTQSRGHFMLILLVLLLHQMNCHCLLPKYNVYTYQLQLRYRYRMAFFYQYYYIQQRNCRFFLVLRIPKRRKNIQYVMKRTCNQLVHSAYEMAPTINFDWLTTPSFVARIFTPRYLYNMQYLVYSNTLPRKNLFITKVYYV